MDFNLQNFVNTTSSIALSTNTILAQNLFNPNLDYQFFSSGDNDDTTITSITYTFDATTPISRIALLDHNFKDFTVYYNGTTANTFSLNNADTSVSDYSSNSETSQYFKFDTIQASSVTIEATGTIISNKEKYLSFLYISDNYFEFDRIPSANSYKPLITPKQVVHSMADGGTKVHDIDKKFSVDIKYKFLTTAQKNQLRTIYDLETPFYFCLFPTTTSWDKVFFEANWVGPFDFETFSDNASTAGHSGSIKLRET